MKETVIWNIESGIKLSGPELGRAEVKRTALFHRVREFMQNYDFLALPVSQVSPFPIGTGICFGNKRNEDGNLSGLDALLLLHNCNRSTCDFGSLRIY